MGVAVLTGVKVAVGVAVSVGVDEISGVRVKVAVDEGLGVWVYNRTILVPEAGFSPSFTRHPASVSNAAATSSMEIALKTRFFFNTIQTSSLIMVGPCFDYRRESIEINNFLVKN